MLKIHYNPLGFHLYWHHHPENWRGLHSLQVYRKHNSEFLGFCNTQGTLLKYSVYCRSTQITTNKNIMINKAKIYTDNVKGGEEQGAQPPLSATLTQDYSCLAAGAQPGLLLSFLQIQLVEDLSMYRRDTQTGADRDSTQT